MALLLQHSCYFHIPKTGGTWVAHALQQAGLSLTYLPCLQHAESEFSQSQAPPCCVHSLPSEVMPLLPRECFTFAFVRNPFTYYQSYWCYKMKAGWSVRNVFDRCFAFGTFEEFVRAVVRVRPGWVTYAYARYLGTPTHPMVSFVGRCESLTDDLVCALRLAGEQFDEGVLRSTPKLNLASATSAWASRCHYTPELRALVAESEKEGLRRFGYSAEGELLATPAPALP